MPHSEVVGTQCPTTTVKQGMDSEYTDTSTACTQTSSDTLSHSISSISDWGGVYIIIGNTKKTHMHFRNEATHTT